VAFPVDILRLPGPPAGERHSDRRIVDETGERIFPRLGQRQHVNERLQQGADRSPCLERTIESDIGAVDAADQCPHLAAMGIGQHQTGLQRWPVLPGQTGHGVGHCQLRHLLRRWRQRRVDLQTGALQRLDRIVLFQLDAHQIHERRIAIGKHARLRIDRQRPGAGASMLGGIDQAGLEKLIEHQIATLQGALGIAPGIVERGALHHSDHQSDFGGAKAVELARKPELAGSADAVNRLSALLPQENLVQIGFQNGRLVEPGLDDQGIQRLIELAPERLLARQVKSAHQLLGERTGALPQFAGTQIHPHRPQHADRIDAPVALEIAVLYRLHASHQQFRHVFQPDQAPLFDRQPEQGGDSRRIEADLRDAPVALDIAQRGHPAVGQNHLNPPRRDRAIDVIEPAAGDHEPAALAGIAAGCSGIGLVSVGGGVQLALQSCRVHRQLGRQSEWPGEHPGRLLPGQCTEARADIAIEQPHIGHAEAEQQAHCRKAQPKQPPSPRNGDVGRFAGGRLAGHVFAVDR